MKENLSNIQKAYSPEKVHEKKETISSPKKSEKSNIFPEIISSPENTKQMNQKFFPLKEKFFGSKPSPIRSFSPKAHSPILTYYGLSPNFQEINYYSPKIKKESPKKINRINSSKMSPNFNTSPSAIFNVTKGGNKNEEDNNVNNNKTLQEKIEPFVKMENMNNINNINLKRDNYNLSEEDDEDNDSNDNSNDNDETYILSFHVDDKNDLNKNLNFNIINNDANKDKNKDNNNNYSNLNNNEENNKFISNENTDVKNIISKSEYMPYIPNNLRNLNEINYIPNNNSNNNINYPTDIYLNIPQTSMNNINQNNIINNINYIENQSNQSRSFYYKGDNYQIISNQENKNLDKNTIPGQIRSITPDDIVTTITSNNKVIKRINPNVYLNESNEFLAYNIFPLAQDQAGCRFLQEKIEGDSENTVKIFFTALIPYLIALIKDPFGNYFVQKFFPYLTEEELKIFLEKISKNILDLGSNHHGTRVIQNIIPYLNNKELFNLFLNCIKPSIIPLLKEMHGVHIINKIIVLHPECSSEINKLIIDNCSSLATDKHGCCFLQKILENPESTMKNELIKSLIENIFVLIIDQFGNYVIQSILFLNNSKYSAEIALRISDSVPYYSKHRYSSNVVEKCFDFCGKKERNVLIDKLSQPEVISELILDEHGNYVIQKVLYYSDFNKREEILNNIRPLIPKIKNTSFGIKLLNKLFTMYPKLNSNLKEERNSNKYQYNFNGYINNNRNKKFNYYNYNNNYNFHNNNYYNYNFNNNYMNYFNNIGNNTNNKNNINNIKNSDMNNNKDFNNNQDIDNNNVALSNYYNINNNTINININKNKKESEDNNIKIMNSGNNIMNEDKDINEIQYNNNTNEHKKKKKKKKGKKMKKNSEEFHNEKNNNQTINNNQNID